MYIDDIWVSEKSILRFLMMMSRIHEGNCVCHQTLTFPVAPDSDVEAKKFLYKLLSTVSKSNPNMASVYVMEYNEAGVLHFHVIFVFFLDEHLPYRREEMAKEFGRYVFKSWNRILGGNANRRANLMRVYRKSPKTAGYLAKKVRPVWNIPEYSSRKTRWWGIRNRELFDNFGKQPDEEEASKEFERIFPQGVRRAYHRRKRSKREFKINSSGWVWNRFRRMRQLHPFGRRVASNRRSFSISEKSFHKPHPIYSRMTNVRGVCRNAMRQQRGEVLFLKKFRLTKY